ncbi:MAG: tRNA threonylcarbamoyladenosine biosynthesis protein TsaB [Paracidovorax wautersii]|uniref:tRNA threonylcarbamoyladenosine biosynthesis protein TsaB n=1 Tax=Paracidovorax wautersii TaxID=1177982 RepID=A0A7V8FKX5_9BURK|nr:MAG: tRNA threonylcarbamoyladenosine biosynthesis protein TsaB [Paracidovorax wautersii]
MKLLALETSTETLSIALGQATPGHDMTVVATYEGAGGPQSSATLLPAVHGLLAQAGWALADLQAIVFGEGPGSFTGLRTACAVAQGLAFGAGLRVLPVDTLMAVAEEARLQYEAQGQPIAAPQRVAAAMDARMDELYLAVYERLPGTSAWRGDGARLASPQDAQFDGVAWLAGNARAAYADRLPAPTLALPAITCLPTARALLHLAPALLAAGLAVAPELAMPRYVRDKVAKTTEERLAERQAAQTAGPR